MKKRIIAVITILIVLALITPIVTGIVMKKNTSDKVIEVAYISVYAYHYFSAVK